MTDANLMRVVTHHATGSQQRTNAVARAIADHVAQQPNPAEFLSKNEATIKAGLAQLGADHWRNLNTAVEALTINSRSALPTVIGSKGVASDAIASQLGSSPRALIAHYINVARGRTGINQEAAAFLGRWFDKLRTDHKAVTMEAIFYDKDAARAIANLARTAPTEKTRGKWAEQLASLGIRAEVAAQE